MDHFSTLRDARNGSLRPTDFGVQVLVPAAAGLGAGLAGATLKDTTGPVAGVSIVAGLLFSMAVFLFQLRLSVAQDKRLDQADFVLIDECMSNVLWAILLGLALAVFLIIASSGGWLATGTTGRVLTGISIAASLHFLLVIAMCLKRLRRAYERVAMGRP